ncbi:hypothetical protein [Xanthomonas maliensis]|uniref:hypothetical protein n=1 Tax=Xanthomonas maliensis TaxID=1321368 RepID=UPI001478082B|nr:hypothetical protein [Xanthomonas maliensis]
MQDRQDDGHASQQATGTSEARVWWQALLELRGGRMIVSLIVVIAIVFGLYMAMK